jgi:hypothetical protein
MVTQLTPLPLKSLLELVLHLHRAHQRGAFSHNWPVERLILNPKFGRLTSEAAARGRECEYACRGQVRFRFPVVRPKRAGAVAC